MPGEQRLGEHVVDEIGGLVLVHVDLFEDHLTLGFDLVGSKRRVPHDVGEDVEPDVEVVVEHTDVERRVLLGGEGVHVAADRVDVLRDLLRRAHRRSLEQQVLEEVRCALLCRGLVA